MALRLAAGGRLARSRAARLPATAGLGVKRIGLLGGSFDPVHLAHLALARAAAADLRLDSVRRIAAPNPWQRAPLRAAAGHRLRMMELAVDGQPQLAVNPVDLERGGPPYSIVTVRALPA